MEYLKEMNADITRLFRSWGDNECSTVDQCLYGELNIYLCIYESLAAIQVISRSFFTLKRGCVELGFEVMSINIFCESLYSRKLILHKSFK